MFKLVKHPNGYASIIGHGLQSQDARTVSYAEGERLVATFDNVESGLREDLRVQIEAECKALTRAQEAENIADELRRDIADLTEKLERSNAGVSLISKKLVARRDTEQKLVTAIRESQKILADYLEPGRKLRATAAIGHLLEVLDHSDLVSLVNSNSEEATPGEPYLDMLSSKPTNWPHWATHLFRDEDGWQFGKLFTGEASKAWYDSDTQATASRLWTEKNMIDGTLEERPRPNAGTGSQAVEIGTAVHDAIERVVNVTTNHFAPEPKASKKQRAALEDAIDLLNGSRFGPAENELIVYRLKRLLKKLS